MESAGEAEHLTGCKLFTTNTSLRPLSGSHRLKRIPYVGVEAPKEAGETVPWTAGTLSDLDLTDFFHSWRLKVRRTCCLLIQCSCSTEGSHQRALREENVLAYFPPFHQTRRKLVSSQKPWLEGGVGGATPPFDPSKLVDVSLRKIKEGVKEPQIYHTVTSGQVGDPVAFSQAPSSFR